MRRKTTITISNFLTNSIVKAKNSLLTKTSNFPLGTGWPKGITMTLTLITVKIMNY